MNLDNWPFKQHELLKTALEATDGYLGVEKQAMAAKKATNAMLHDFTYHMSRAHDALQQLGVLDQHQDYMTAHVNVMTKLHGHDDPTISDLPYIHVPRADYGEVEESVEEAVWDQAKARANLPKEKLSPSSKAKAKARAKAAGRPYPNMVDNIWAARQQESTLVSFSSFLKEEDDTSEDEKITEEDIDKMVNDLNWEDIADLYDEEELVDDGEEDEEDESDKEEKEQALDEKLSVQARLKKRQAFARMRGKRNVARNLKLRRPSTINVLKKRAVLAARRAVYKRFLRGRDKSTLSAAEKDRIEQQVARMKYMQAAIATKMLPKMRSIEQKRLAGYRAKTSAPKLKPSRAPRLK